MLQAVLADFELVIEEKAAKVEIGNLETINAIPLQINQLFFNLIGNALKFSRKDVTPVITISGHRLNALEQQQQYPDLQAGRAYYEMLIADNGIGFEQGYAEKIFLAFQRLNSQTEYNGYGIGLALCSKVASNHGGAIRAEGSLNEGARFFVVLPIE
jgi:light-regulated signal transduction histidine kinase (bacteriophytochrome)